MKTCSLCGRRYQTMATRGYRYCHNCALTVLTRTIDFMLPILFEFTQDQLLKLDKKCVLVRMYIKKELVRRSNYYSNMLDQRKPR